MEVSHDIFVFTSSTFSFWRMSRTKASFSHLQLLVFEGSLDRKLRFHTFNFQTLREVSHESFAFTSSAFRYWGKSRTNASLPDSSSVSNKKRFWETADARNAVFCRAKRVSEDEWGRFAALRLRNAFGSGRIMLRSAAQWNCQFRRFVFTSSTFKFWGKSRAKASFSRLSTFRYWGKSRTNASLADFEGRLE